MLQYHLLNFFPSTRQLLWLELYHWSHGWWILGPFACALRLYLFIDLDNIGFGVHSIGIARILATNQVTVNLHQGRLCKI